MGLRTLWALVVSAVIMGCASSGGLPPAATQKASDGGDYAYVIGAGDQLQAVRVISFRSLSGGIRKYRVL